MKGDLTLPEVIISFAIVVVLFAIVVPSCIKAKKDQEHKEMIRKVETNIILEKGTEVLPIKTESSIVINEISMYPRFTIYKIVDTDNQKIIYLIESCKSIDIAVAIP